MNKLKITAFFILCMLSATSQAQLYNIKHYSVEDGLPQANSDCLIQDSLGYIWIATQVGAVRFDGFNYMLLNEEQGLATHIIRRIFLDKNNNLWFGTYNGLSFYNYDTIVNYSTKDGLPSKFIQHLWEDENQNLWVMTAKGACYFNGTQFVSNENSLGLKGVNSSFKNEDKVFLATNKGIVIQKDGKFYDSHYGKIKDFQIADIVKDNQGNIWATTRSKGLLKILNDDSYIVYNEENGFATNYLSHLQLSHNGKLWIGTEGKGVILFDGESFINISEENGLTNTSVLDIMEDQESNIWLGGRNGISMINPHDPFTHYPDANKSSKESVFGMLHDSQDNLWFTTYGNGLSMYDGQKFRYFSESDGIGDNRLFSIIESKNGDIWLSTAAKGIVKYSGNKFVVYDNERGFANVRVFKIFEDREGNLWSCTSGMGAVKYDGAEFHSYTVSHGLPGNIVMSGLEDSKGHIWFGHFGEGISKYENGSFIDFSSKYKIPPKHIRSICEDTHANIWFGTASNGVFRIEDLYSDSASCYYINKQKGLSSNNIYFVFFDSSGLLWAGTEKGIDKIALNKNHEVLHIDNYSKQEGFIGMETTINGAMQDKDGNLWFGSSVGATKYIPHLEQKNNNEPKTHITNIKLFYKDTIWDKFADSIDFNGLPINLTLNHEQNHLTFDFIGICFTNPDKVTYKFMLEGLDHEWSPLTNNRQAVYSNLSPGKYTFKLLACNNEGIWNKKPAMFSFEIEPPFWQKPQFYITLSLLIVLSITIAIRIRIRNLKISTKRLEEKVRERTEQIFMQKEQIQEKNEELHQINEELNSQKNQIIAQRDLVRVQKKSLERVHKQVTDSILYAEKIQKAVFPSEKYLNKIFKGHFVFYKPLHIVSGDFYWALRKKNHLLFAVADCTGHGVPGGFMSMLGVAMLSEIVNKPEITNPHKALNELREYIILSLRQKGLSGEQKDGLDIALCAYNTETHEFEFSGANNPILITTSLENAEKVKKLRNEKIKIYTDDENALLELMPDKMPVSHYEKMDSFTSIKLKFSGDETLYLFSDGFTDQFGGNQNRKYTKTRFRELIFSLQGKDILNQKSLLASNFKNWKKDNKQVDDVLVMAVKL